ncbi:MAG: 23S rRNA (adenine(2030)-N(6))-methyltransferase RlmJ [Gammaproteobacteria bacterium]|nr:23S rRNA (adenine(2030)-N(6))-methyltransferase RlmJ [Gammaproteobacteria bacterium]
MLSYRHAFHAGNRADCHKHAQLHHVLTRLAEKPRPMSLMDAFAGAGEYALESEEALKTGEAASGIRELAARDEADAALAPYLDAVRPWLARSAYPGSPMIMANALREGDELQLLELHPRDVEHLRRCARQHPAVHVHQRDAREGVKGLLPMQHRRGLVLLDPPYERLDEYQEVVALLEAVEARWPQAVLGLWYPLLADPARDRARQAMLDGIAASGLRRVYRQELVFDPDAHGLRGSGMLWLRPPWQAEQAFAAIGAGLLAVFGGQRGAEGWLVEE